MSSNLKLAKDLVDGDRVVIKADDVVTVLAIVPTYVTQRRNMLIVTLRDKLGNDIYRKYHENTPVRVVV